VEDNRFAARAAPAPNLAQLKLWVEVDLAAKAWTLVFEQCADKTVLVQGFDAHERGIGYSHYDPALDPAVRSVAGEIADGSATCGSGHH
jgi:hypothetical protein